MSRSTQHIILQIGPQFSEIGLQRIRYTIDQININPISLSAGIEILIGEDKPNLTYGAEEDGKMVIPAQRILFNEQYVDWNINKYDDKYYSVEKGAKPGEKPFYKEGAFSFDLLEAIYFHLSRIEETIIKQTDYFRNKLAFEEQLLLVKNGLEKIPVVDILIHGLLEVVTGRTLAYPKDKALSHDIDFIEKFSSPLSIIRKIAGHIRHRKSVKGFSHLWKTYMDYLRNGQDAFDTFDWMMSSANIEKNIYFLMGGSHREDNRYDDHHPTFRKAIKLARERNYKIGIHPSYESWNNTAKMKEEKERLERILGNPVNISRQHFLNFDVKVTPEVLLQNDIVEDSSLGYARRVGYRCGTGYPYYLYDFAKESATNILEKPLAFMDVAWLFEYERTGNYNLETIGNYYGMYNFHNSTFDEMAVRGIEMKEAYQKLFSS